MARTETRARCRIVHLALFFRLLLHVNQRISHWKFSPLAMLTEDFSQLDLCKHTRIHRRCEPRPLFCGRRNEQLLPRRIRLRVYPGSGSIAGVDGRRRVVHTLGRASDPLRTLTLACASPWGPVARDCRRM